MTDETKTLPLPADVLCRKLSTFRGLADIAKDVAAKGLIEYGQPLSVESEVVVKIITGSDTVTEHREPLTIANALDNAIREGIDAACYAIVAQQKNGDTDEAVSKEIARATWQMVYGIQSLYVLMQQLSD